ncbi:MAG: 30S ribosomal protein S16 [bacterium]|nr:30S ribosomal protein S16 [bacterium]
MLMLKLKRIGKKHQASFRLIVDEKRHKLFGRHVEDLGWYNPRTDKSEIKKDRVEYWMKTGAKPTDTVYNLLITAGILSGKKIAVHSQPKKKEGDANPPAGGPAAAAPAAPASADKAPAAADPAAEAPAEKVA